MSERFAVLVAPEQVVIFSDLGETVSPLTIKLTNLDDRQQPSTMNIVALSIEVPIEGAYLSPLSELRTETPRTMFVNFLGVSSGPDQIVNLP